MDVNQLLENLKQQGIKHLSLFSQEVDSTTAFIALQGAHQHALNFAQEAIDRGARCFILDEKDEFTHPEVTVFYYPNLKYSLGYLASAFYQHPSRQLRIHAVTGTNGKTSCTQFIAQALQRMNKPCAVIGTLGIGVWPNLTPIPYTTPDAVTLQRFFAFCLREQVYDVSMEASSIAIEEQRLQNIHLHSIIFTNLTQDHLDYHQTMEAYQQAKQKLFDFPGIRYAVINQDDPFGQRLFQQYAQKMLCLGYTTQQNVDAFVHTQKATFSPSGMSVTVQIPETQAHLKSSLLGAFNLSNMLAVLTWLLGEGIHLAAACAILSELKAPPGRMQALEHGPYQPLVIVDYAHTPDALEKALQALRAHTQGQLICVFGCGGDRDKTKRPLMGKIASTYANSILLTSDNPRDEDPQAILNDILSGISDTHAVRVYTDRREAIEKAIHFANEKDVILIAGKGHETTQDIQGKKYPFDDISVAREILMR